jgi:hypothetical protein
MDVLPRKDAVCFNVWLCMRFIWPNQQRENARTHPDVTLFHMALLGKLLNPTILLSPALCCSMQCVARGDSMKAECRHPPGKQLPSLGVVKDMFTLRLIWYRECQWFAVHHKGFVQLISSS